MRIARVSVENFRGIASGRVTLCGHKEWRGVHLMTIHKAKSKEFDEVVVYEGRHARRIVPADADPGRQAQARLALRVAVTRATKRATIVTPAGARCIFV